MIHTTFNLKMADDTDLFIRKWIPNSNVKFRAVIQLVHGMGDHSGRYHDFAEALVKENFAVYANDHRGHGDTADSPEDRGYFADENGWQVVVDDMYQLTQKINQDNPGIPIILLGHSLGALLSRSYIQKYGDHLQGVIILSTGGDQGVAAKIAAKIAKMEMKLRGKRAKSKLMTTLVFHSYNKDFKPIRTPFDWISRDKKEVDKYIKDEMAGEVLTAGFYFDMICGVIELHKEENEAKVPKDLPIFLLSGDKDPLGKQGKDVKKVYKSYKNQGIQDVEYKLYKDARHELLNEINKDEVYQDIINWIQSKI